MLVRVPVQCTEDIATSTVESCKKNTTALVIRYLYRNDVVTSMGTTKISDYTIVLGYKGTTHLTYTHTHTHAHMHVWIYLSNQLFYDTQNIEFSLPDL